VLLPLSDDLARPLWKIVCPKNTWSIAKSLSSECINIRKSSAPNCSEQRLVSGRETNLYQRRLFHQMLASRDIRLLALTKQLDTRDRSTLFHNFPQTTILSRQTHQQPPSHPAGFYQIQKLPFSFLQTRISENLVGNFGQAFTLVAFGAIY
jgi:hypothetical protein